MATKTLATRRQQHPQLACIVDTLGPRGQHLGREFFVVTPETYGEGYETGERLALDMIRAMRSPEGARFSVLSVLKAAGAAVVEWDPSDRKPSTRGAGVGFLRTVEWYLGAGAAVADPDTVQRQWQTRRATVEARLMRERQARRDDFLRRMEVGKAAAARRRAQAGIDGAEVAHG